MVGVKPGYKQTPDHIQKRIIKRSWYKHSKQFKERMKGHKRMMLAHKRILDEVPKLEEQGFLCIPITSVIPDIIALKDGKVYAIEIEYQKPNLEKYERSKWFDEVVWIIHKK